MRKNNVYGLFPFFTPKKMKDSLTEQGLGQEYTFGRPHTRPLPHVLNNLRALRHILDDPSSFRPVHGSNLPGNSHSFTPWMNDTKTFVSKRTYKLFFTHVS